MLTEDVGNLCYICVYFTAISQCTTAVENKTGVQLTHFIIKVIAEHQLNIHKYTVQTSITKLSAVGKAPTLYIYIMIIHDIVV